MLEKTNEKFPPVAGRENVAKSIWQEQAPWAVPLTETAREVLLTEHGLYLALGVLLRRLRKVAPSASDLREFRV